MANLRLPGTRPRRAHGSSAAAHGEAAVLPVAISYLDQHAAELPAREPGVRSGEPEAVHNMRTASRRLRSCLEVHAILFDTERGQQLGADLKWFARNLGRERDAEVVRERLLARLRDLPEHWRTEAVSGPLERALDAACAAGHAQVLHALGSPRYRRMLEDLAGLREAAPAAGLTLSPAETRAFRLVNDQARRVDRAHRTMLRTDHGHARVLALHRLRKDTKWLLHAAESVATIHPKHAAALARTAHRLQRILGNHQDSVMAREFLQSFTTNAGLPGELRLACQRLREIKEGIADSAERQYAKARRRSGALRLRR